MADEPGSDLPRLALVTGTSSGIGAAITSALLEEGWTVVGMSRRQADFDNSRYRHIPIDLGDLAAVNEVAQRELAPIVADARWLRVGLVNNAAAPAAFRPLEDTDPVKLARLFAVNTVAPIFLMGFVVRLAPPTAVLRVANISSGAAVQPAPGIGDYGSSKAALRLAGMTLAAELGSDQRPGGSRPNVAILSFAPGVVDTAMQEEARTSRGPWKTRFVQLHAEGRLLPPRAPALEVVRFLSSDSAEPFVERRFGAA